MNKKTLVITIAIALVLVAALVLVWVNFGPKTTQGSKAITIEVVYEDGETETYELKTDALYLKEAMDEAGIEYTLEDGMVMSVNGVSAVYTVDGAYWSIEVNGDYGMNGIETQPVTDGDSYRLVYTLA